MGNEGPLDGLHKLHLGLADLHRQVPLLRVADAVLPRDGPPEAEADVYELPDDHLKGLEPLLPLHIAAGDDAVDVPVAGVADVHYEDPMPLRRRFGPLDIVGDPRAQASMMQKTSTQMLFFIWL